MDLDIDSLLQKSWVCRVHGTGIKQLPFKRHNEPVQVPLRSVIDKSLEYGGDRIKPACAFLLIVIALEETLHGWVRL